MLLLPVIIIVVYYFYHYNSREAKNIRLYFLKHGLTASISVDLPFAYSAETIRQKLENYGYEWVIEFNHDGPVIAFRKGDWYDEFWYYIAYDKRDGNMVSVQVVPRRILPIGRASRAEEVKDILLRNE